MFLLLSSALQQKLLEGFDDDHAAPANLVAFDLAGHDQGIQLFVECSATDTSIRCCFIGRKNPVAEVGLAGVVYSLPLHLLQPKQFTNFAGQPSTQLPNIA
jgi:hypothetical protein